MNSLSADAEAIARLASHVAKQKDEATRASLVVPEFATWKFDVVSQADLVVLVSECYKWWKESWADDIQFLADQLRAGDGTVVKAFTRLIHLLRTAHQHVGNTEAREFYEEWLHASCGSKQPQLDREWNDCGVALRRTLGQALIALAALADAALLDQRTALAWMTLTETRRNVDLPSSRALVAQDLGLTIRRGSQDYVDRQIEAQWRRRIRTIQDDAQSALDSVIERWLVGWSISTLPCAYSEVLDKLDCWADERAVAALTLAHAVADLAEYQNTEQFLEGLAAMWTLLSGSQLAEPGI
jgi:hypothetical protein